MDPQHYRLGNLLREVNSGKIVEVIGLSKSATQLKFPTCNVIDYKIEVSGSFEDEWQVEEIPLTYNVFKILGFPLISGKEGEYYQKDDIKLASINNRFYFFNGIDSHKSIELTKIHELQNTYFLLHKRELNVSALNPEPIPNPHD